LPKAAPPKRHPELHCCRAATKLLFLLRHHPFRFTAAAMWFLLYSPGRGVHFIAINFRTRASRSAKMPAAFCLAPPLPWRRPGDQFGYPPQLRGDGGQNKLILRCTQGRKRPSSATNLRKSDRQNGLSTTCSASSGHEHPKRRPVLAADCVHGGPYLGSPLARQHAQPVQFCHFMRGDVRHHGDCFVRCESYAARPFAGIAFPSLPAPFRCPSTTLGSPLVSPGGAGRPSHPRPKENGPALDRPETVLGCAARHSFDNP
jgi:hypothetical protein